MKRNGLFACLVGALFLLSCESSAARSHRTWRKATLDSMDRYALRLAQNTGGGAAGTLGTGGGTGSDLNGTPGMGGGMATGGGTMGMGGGMGTGGGTMGMGGGMGTGGGTMGMGGGTMNTGGGTMLGGGTGTTGYPGAVVGGGSGAGTVERPDAGFDPFDAGAMTMLR